VAATDGQVLETTIDAKIAGRVHDAKIAGHELAATLKASFRRRLIIEITEHQASAASIDLPRFAAAAIELTPDDLRDIEDAVSRIKVVGDRYPPPESARMQRQRRTQRPRPARSSPAPQIVIAIIPPPLMMIARLFTGRLIEAASLMPSARIFPARAKPL